MGSNQRAFVAGATGHTGREVVRILCERAVPTIAHVRPDSPRRAEWRERFEALGAEVDATPWDEHALAATLAGHAPTVVFALLGTTRHRGRQAAREGKAPETYETVDYGLTAMLLAAVRTLATPPRFVYLSSMGVSPRSRNPYMKVRHRMEQELRDGGVPFTIARPSFITGAPRDEGRPLERVGAATSDAALGLLGVLGGRGVRDRYASMANTDLARALVAAALDPAHQGALLEADDLRSLARRG
jgi:nucleoside-diphosphate-sugar epimerase